MCVKAAIYEREGDEQQTYLLLFRHAQLVLRNLPCHPQAGLSQSRLALVSANRDVQQNLKKLEVLKPRITKRHERYFELIRARDARRESQKNANQVVQRDKGARNIPKDLNKSLPSEPAIAYDFKTIAAGENKELAVKLAHNELRRRASERKSTRQAGILPEEEQDRRTAGMWDDWDRAFSSNDQITEDDGLSTQLETVRLQIDGSTERRVNHTSAHVRPASAYHYPPVAEKINHPDRGSPSQSSGNRKTNLSHATDLPPQRPPKHELSQGTVAPDIPEKRGLDGDDSIFSSELVTSPSLQPGPVSPAYTFEPSSYLENGRPLRTIFLPPTLRHHFVDIALPNTRANLETCGVLCGTLISNALFISKLVIPDQESTSDTCEMMNESALFDFVDGEDLMVLGWIHTHPTQTCFMSSRDLHTHCGYQVMMPESIAIVCAPSKGE